MLQDRDQANPPGMAVKLLGVVLDPNPAFLWSPGDGGGEDENGRMAILLDLTSTSVP